MGRVYRTIQIHPNQDHRLLVTELIVPTDKTARFVKHNTKSQSVDKSKLSNIETRRAFKERIKDICTLKVSIGNATNLETKNNALIDTVKEAGADILPKQRKPKKTKNSWSDNPILLELIRIRNTELRKTPNDKTALKNANGDVKKRATTLINNYYENEAEKINLLNEQHETRQPYNRAKAQKIVFNKYSELQIEPKKLATHFETHFKRPTNNRPIPETLSNPPKKITDELRKLSEDFPLDNTIPPEHDLRIVIRKLNGNKKSSDADIEMFRTACEDETFLNMFIIQ